MIRFLNEQVEGWHQAIRGMRNPMKSWSKSDSYYGCKEAKNGCGEDCTNKFSWQFNVGENDEKLMRQLAQAGSDHRKFMRMIVVYVDIKAPLYWWKEFDTYKVGTVANSESTMHKLHSERIMTEDFSIDENKEESDQLIQKMFERTVTACEFLRTRYVKCKELADKAETEEGRNEAHAKAQKYWRSLIQLLPESYNQTRTVMMNYEVLRNIYKARSFHKLSEWRDFCRWARTLPHSWLITGGKENGILE